MKKIFVIVALASIIFSCSNDASKESEENNNLLEASTNDGANATESNTNPDESNTNPDEVSNNEVALDKNGSPEMTFNETEYDFGNINQGDKVAHTFVFTNTGKSPLIIKDAKGSCGCTVPEYPKEPIAPGKKGKIHVEFDSNGKSGTQNKSVTLTTNMTPAQKMLYIKANVASKNDKVGPVAH